MTACGEACANAIEHAYGPRAATFQLDAMLDGGRDHASPCETSAAGVPPEATTGRGLGTELMKRLMDSVDIEGTSEGTEVRLRRRLRSTGRA